MRILPLVRNASIRALRLSGNGFSRTSRDGFETFTFRGGGGPQGGFPGGGAFDDIEVARREAARPDGVVIHNPGMKAEFDDSAKMANIEGQLKFLERAQSRIDNYGPNLSLVGGDS